MQVRILVRRFQGESKAGQILQARRILKLRWIGEAGRILKARRTLKVCRIPLAVILVLGAYSVLPTAPASSLLPTAPGSCLLPTAPASCLGPPTTSAQQVVDKMVATVNAGVRTDLITYSDLLWQLALQPNTPLANPTSADLNRALRLVIDQRLILQEAEKLPTIAPTENEIKNTRDALVKEFPSLAEFQLRLIRVGLSSEKLDEILEQRIRIEKYLDFRFRNFVLITQTEIADYYDDVYVPRLRRRFPGQIVPTLEEVRDQIENLLTEAKIESDTDAFLDSARERAEIVMLSSV